MAKDGTMRGGARAGAGRKPDPLATKILEGKIKEDGGLNELPINCEIVGEDMPPVKEYLKAVQRDGSVLCSEEVYKDIYNWLYNLGVEKKVNLLLVEQYALSVGRWVDCENKITTTGYLAKHPTTGAAISSPYVTIAQGYYKQLNNAWLILFQAVKEVSTDIINGTPHDDLMEQLLKSRGA